MSIKHQKVIRFVPFLNFFVTVFSLIRAYRNNDQAKLVDVFKFVFIGFIAVILVNLPQIILSNIFANTALEWIFTYLSAYITLLVISSLAIFQQEKYIANSQDKQ